jgi:hypothetical protein
MDKQVEEQESLQGSAAQKWKKSLRVQLDTIDDYGQLDE